VRGLGVENLADRPDARVRQMLAEALEEFRAVRLARVRLPPRIEEVTDEPGPVEALMIRRGARAQTPS